LLYIQEH